MAGVLSAAAGAVLAALLAVRALLAFGLIAYGAWLAWPPAGFITAGVLLLADRLLEERGKQAADE